MAGVTAGATRRVAQVGTRGAGGPYSDGFRRTLLMLIVVSWLIQIHPALAGQRLDPYRLVLLVMFFPFLSALWSRRAGWFLVTDAMILGFGAWIILTFVLHHGGRLMAFGSIQAVEFFGGYAAGRLLIRSPEDYRRYVRYSLGALLVLAPLAAVELVTGRMLFAEVFGRFVSVNEKFQEMRYGLSRVQAGFPHSILFGLFCSIQAANVMYLYRDRLTRLVPRMALVIGMTLASLSSAPSLSIIIQAMTYLWGAITGNRWRMLVGLAVATIIFLEFASNRGPAILLIELVTLDPSTGWWRYYIWVHGIANVKASPFVGIGMNDWVRPSWMFSASVDNFWLVVALRHGLIGLGLLLAPLAIHVWRIVRAKGLSPEAQLIRTGYLVGLTGLCFALTTVHVWDVLAVCVMFYFGAGSFLYTAPEALGGSETGGDAAEKPHEGPRGAPLAYARKFPKPDRGRQAGDGTPK
jgi:hypothetical protein